MKDLFSKIFSAAPSAALLMLGAAFFPASVDAAPPRVIMPRGPQVVVAPPPQVVVAPPPKVIVAPPPKVVVAPPPKVVVAPPPRVDDRKYIKIVGESGFYTEISHGVVLVDFYADWCPPCRRQAPIAASAATKMPRGAKIIKVNVDQAKNVARRFKIRSIPTWVVFKNGREVQRFSGLRQERFLIDTARRYAR